MTELVVVDASLALKWILGEPYAPEARALLDEWRKRGVAILALTLLANEPANVFSRLVREDKILPDYAEDRLRAFLGFFPSLVHEPEITIRALRITMELSLSAAYDPHYVALAEAADCDLWTGDRPLWEAARESYRVRHISEYHPGQ